MIEMSGGNATVFFLQNLTNHDTIKFARRLQRVGFVSQVRAKQWVFAEAIQG